MSHPIFHPIAHLHSNQHIKFVFESDHLVLYDVSTLGSMLTVQGCQRQRTRPKEDFLRNACCLLEPKSL